MGSVLKPSPDLAKMISRTDPVIRLINKFLFFMCKCFKSVFMLQNYKKKQRLETKIGFKN